jgi:hypothetical protein
MSGATSKVGNGCDVPPQTFAFAGVPYRWLPLRPRLHPHPRPLRLAPCRVGRAGRRLRRSRGLHHRQRRQRRTRRRGPGQRRPQRGPKSHSAALAGRCRRGRRAHDRRRRHADGRAAGGSSGRADDRGGPGAAQHEAHCGGVGLRRPQPGAPCLAAGLRASDANADACDVCSHSWLRIILLEGAACSALHEI